ncbi:hypothetical protein F4810DRAFT_719671 [Camillea tinctor]|nr:hypothetical protein F4810DRAFT_719671 [Camillea tinctor]
MVVKVLLHKGYDMTDIQRVWPRFETTSHATRTYCAMGLKAKTSSDTTDWFEPQASEARVANHHDVLTGLEKSIQPQLANVWVFERVSKPTRPIVSALYRRRTDHRTSRGGGGRWSLSHDHNLTSFATWDWPFVDPEKLSPNLSNIFRHVATPKFSYYLLRLAWHVSIFVRLPDRVHMMENHMAKEGNE